jgi:hypothetical protein
MTKFETHAAICGELTALYERKNHDYGDSFGKSFAEYGMAMPCIRLEDKLNRLKALTRSGDQRVSDESIDDTLMDLANYAIMTLVERALALRDQVHAKGAAQKGTHDPNCYGDCLCLRCAHDDNGTVSSDLYESPCCSIHGGCDEVKTCPHYQKEAE